MRQQGVSPHPPRSPAPARPAPCGPCAPGWAAGRTRPVTPGAAPPQTQDQGGRARVADVTDNSLEVRHRRHALVEHPRRGDGGRPRLPAENGAQEHLRDRCDDAGAPRAAHRRDDRAARAEEDRRGHRGERALARFHAIDADGRAVGGERIVGHFIVEEDAARRRHDGRPKIRVDRRRDGHGGAGAVDNRQVRRAAVGREWRPTRN